MSPAIPPARPSIRVIRSSPYRGGTRQWSQRFFWSGANFDLAEFEVMADNLRDLLKLTLPDTGNIVEYVGYDIGTDVPVHTKTVTTAGTYPSNVGHAAPLEVCALARLTTDVRTTKNHPIYGFKYFHQVPLDSGADHELLLDGYKTTLAGQIDDLLAGVSDGDSVRQWCDARGAVFQDGEVKQYVTHRDFP